MDLTIPGIASVVILLGGMVGSYMTSQTDIAINANNIQHITKQLDRIEGHLIKDKE